MVQIGFICYIEENHGTAEKELREREVRTAYDIIAKKYHCHVWK